MAHRSWASILPGLAPVVLLLGAAAVGKTTFFKGSGASAPLFNLSGATFFEGSGSSRPLCNLKGSTLYQGSGSSSPILNVRSGTAFEGSGSSMFSLPSARGDSSVRLCMVNVLSSALTLMRVSSPE